MKTKFKLLTGVATCLCMGMLFTSSINVASTKKANEYNKTMWKSLKQYDTNKDNALSEKEKNKVTYLNLKTDNELKNVDVSEFKNLRVLKLSEGKVEKINLKGCTSLRKLECAKNSIKELDLSEQYELRELNCEDNQLTNLDLSQKSELVSLFAAGNNLTQLKLYTYEDNSKLQNKKAVYGFPQRLVSVNDEKLLKSNYKDTVKMTKKSYRSDASLYEVIPSRTSSVNDTWNRLEVRTEKIGDMICQGFLSKDKKKAWITDILISDNVTVKKLMVPSNFMGAKVVRIGENTQEKKIEGDIWKSNILGESINGLSEQWKKKTRWYSQNAIAKVVIPNEVTEISEACFGGFKNLKEVKLSKNVKNINEYTFYCCKSLQKISLKKINIKGNRVFEFCDSFADMANCSNGTTLTYKNGQYLTNKEKELRAVNLTANSFTFKKRVKFGYNCFKEYLKHHKKVKIIVKKKDKKYYKKQAKECGLKTKKYVLKVK